MTGPVTTTPFEVVLIYVAYTKQTQNMCVTFVQCWTNVEDVGPTLYKCYANVLCLLGSLIILPGYLYIESDVSYRHHSVISRASLPLKIDKIDEF